VVSLIGPKIFWPSKSWKKEPEHRTSAKLGDFIGRKPALVTAVAGLVLVAFTIASFSFKAKFDSAPAPKGSESAQGLDDMKKDFAAGASAAPVSNQHSWTVPRVTKSVGDAVPTALKNTTRGEVPPRKKDKPLGDIAQIRLSLKDDPMSAAAMKNIKGP